MNAGGCDDRDLRFGTEWNAKAVTAAMTGACQCGELRFDLTDKPLFVHACHCVKCQKSSGSVFGITTIILESDIRISTGSLTIEPMAAAPHRLRHLCAECRDHIYTTATNHPATALLRNGTLDDPRQLLIDAHIFVKRKRPWLSLPEDVLQFPAGYDREKAWPTDSLARLKQATMGP